MLTDRHGNPLIGGRYHRIGRVQRQCRRALIAHGTATIRDLLSWCYPKSRSYSRWQRKSVLRAIRKFGLPARPPRQRFAGLWMLK